MSWDGCSFAEQFIVTFKLTTLEIAFRFTFEKEKAVVGVSYLVTSHNELNEVEWMRTDCVPTSFIG